MKKKDMIFLFLISVLTPSLWAGTIVIDKEDGKYPVGRHIEYFEDVDGHMQLDEIIEIYKAGRFTESEVLNLNFGFTQTAYWIRFVLSNPSLEEESLLLEYGHPHMDLVQLYLMREGQQVGFADGGDSFPYSYRQMDYQNIIFSLMLPPNSSTEIYMRFHTQGSMQIPLTLWRSQSLTEKINKEQWLLGLYFGLMGALLIYNAFLFFSLKDINYLFYILYLFPFIMVQLGINRLDVQYLWPDSIIFANLSFPMFYNLAFFFAGLFSRSFLNTKKMTPLLDKLILILMAIAVSGFIMTFAVSYNAGFLPVLYVLATLEPLLLMIAGLRCWRKGYKVARYYTIAWTGLIITATVFNLRNITVLPSVFITDYSLYFGSALEVLFLSLALADRINSIKAEKLQAKQEAFEAQQQLTTKLETLVAERTRELKESNSKLENLSNIDGLTGLYNRRFFDATLKKEWLRSQRAKSDIALLIGDIDHFKKFNDTYGHPAGDKCIKAVSAAIMSSLKRSSDTAARYGGEEFAVILPECDAGGAGIIARRILDSVRELNIEHCESETAGTVSLSLGAVSIVPGNDVTIDGFVEACDKALYISKKNGRDRFTIERIDPNIS